MSLRQALCDLYGFGCVIFHLIISMCVVFALNEKKKITSN